MLILGVIAVLQMAFIPGWLCLNAVRFETCGAVQKTVYALGLSLLLNYGLVVSLTLVHLYTTRAVYMVLILEGILLLYFYFGAYQQVPSTVHEPVRLSASGQILWLMAAMLMAAFIYYALVNANEVFRLFDAVVSWNRWAVDWAHNMFPYKTAEYPQLIPANWSLTYVIIQNTDVQLFARALMPLFPLAIMLLMFDWTFKHRNQVGVLALIFYAVIMLYFYQPDAMIDGYVDIAVSFFGLLTFSVIYNSQLYRRWGWKQIFLAGLFAAAAALTKQAGLFVLGAFLGWSIWILIKHYDSMGGKEIIRVLGAVITVVIIVGVWYLAKEMQISRGADYSAVQLVTHDIYGGASLQQRLVNAATLLVNARGQAGHLIFVVLAAAFMAGFFCRQAMVLALLCITYLMAWGLFFSYDTRNLTLIYPVAALVMAHGIEWASGKWRWTYRGWFFTIMTVTVLAGLTYYIIRNAAYWLRQPDLRWWGLMAAIAMGAGMAIIFMKRKRLSVPHQAIIVSVLAVILLMAGSLYFTSQHLLNSQIEKQKQLGIGQLNARLYDYERQQGISGKILSDYIFLPFLPELKEKTVYRQWPEGIYTALQQESDLGALLISNTALAQDDIKQQALKRFDLVFTHNGYTFLMARY